VWRSPSQNGVPQVKAEFKWQPCRNKPETVTIWRENFEVSPALCFTEYKVIGSTLDSVIIHLPDPADLKGKKTMGLQQKLVLLSRTRRTADLAFLCRDDYDFFQFLQALDVPQVRCRLRVPPPQVDTGRVMAIQDLEHEWRRLERIGNHTHELSMRAPWWSSVTTSTRSAPSQPSRDSTATPAAVIRRPRRGHRHRHPDDASPLPSKRLRPHDHATSTIVRTPTAVDDLGVFVGPRLNRPARQGQPPVADGYSSRRDAVTSALDTSDTAPVRNAKLDFDGWSNKK
jgi:hypothetical protein